MILQSILELSTQEMLSDYVTAIAWSPVGNMLAAASGAGEVQVLNQGVGILLVQPGVYSIDALAFSADGKWLAAGGQNGTITLWQVESGTFKLADTLDCGGWIDRLSWHPTCNYLVFNQGKVVKIWDVEHSEMVTMLPGIGSPQDIRWSPNGKQLAIAAQGNFDWTLWLGHNGPVAVCLGSADGHSLCAISGSLQS